MSTSSNLIVRRIAVHVVGELALHHELNERLSDTRLLGENLESLTREIEQAITEGLEVVDRVALCRFVDELQLFSGKR